MRSHFAIYVDVGYLLAAAATRVTGTSLRRGVEVDYPELISSLVTRAADDCGLPMLRVNWYDSGARPGGMPDYIQDEIGLLPRVKLRLGRLSHAGEQKGVDLRIGLDLAAHGRNRVVDVIYLVSGDDDLTEAVEEAQNHGVQVILLAVPGQDGKPHGVSRHLQRAADGLVLASGEVIDEVVRSRAIPEPLVPEEFKPEDETEPAEVGEGVEAADPDHADSDHEVEEVAAAADAAGAAGAPEVPEAAAPAPGSTDAGRVEDAGQSGHPGPLEVAAGPNGAGPAPGVEPSGTEVGAGPELAGEVAAEADAPAAATPTAAAAENDAAHCVPGPTPSVFAHRRATTIVPPPEPVWTSATDGTSHGSYGGGVTSDLIEAVARQVVRSWCATATPEDLADLKRQRPSIPPDLDRALLMDLSTKSEQYDIDEASRHELRNRFWQVVRQVKLT